MSISGGLIIISLFIFPFKGYKCADIVSNFGSTELIAGTQKAATYDEAKKKCKEKGATLVELYDENEWDQVTSKITYVFDLICF